MVKFVVMAGSAVAMLAAGTAFGQSTTATGNSQIGSLTCGDIASLPLANQAALIYYAAGYRDGLVDGAGAGASGSGDAPGASSAMDTSAMSSSEPDGGMSSAEGGSAAGDSGASNGGLVAGLGLDAQLVVTACTTSADALLTDVIGTSGGTSGAATSPSGSSNSSGASSNAGASSEASGAESSSAAGDSGTSGASSSAQ